MADEESYIQELKLVRRRFMADANALLRYAGLFTAHVHQIKTTRLLLQQFLIERPALEHLFVASCADHSAVELERVVEGLVTWLTGLSEEQAREAHKLTPLIDRKEQARAYEEVYVDPDTNLPSQPPRRPPPPRVAPRPAPNGKGSRHQP
jgi:hypothetical protein